MGKTATFSRLLAAIVVTAISGTVTADTDQSMRVLTQLASQLVTGTESTATLEKVANQESNKLVNKKLDGVENQLKDNINLVYLDLKIASDSLGIDGSSSEIMFEGLGVYRLHETETAFVFNQSSINRFDGRTTLNTGIGVRAIRNESLLLGSNLFYDHELDSDHSRWGLGFELLTETASLTTNLYRALSDTRTVDGINEMALDGHDFRFSYRPPVKYHPKLFATDSRFEDNKSYKTEMRDWGIELPLGDHFLFSISSQKQDEKGSQTVSSLTYSLPLWRGASPSSIATQNLQLRDLLYRPVERENRIMKKKLNLGVTISGF